MLCRIRIRTKLFAYLKPTRRIQRLHRGCGPPRNRRLIVNQRFGAPASTKHRQSSLVCLSVSNGTQIQTIFSVRHFPYLGFSNLFRFLETYSSRSKLRSWRIVNCRMEDRRQEPWTTAITCIVFIHPIYSPAQTSSAVQSWSVNQYATHCFPFEGDKTAGQITFFSTEVEYRRYYLNQAVGISFFASDFACPKPFLAVMRADLQWQVIAKLLYWLQLILSDLYQPRDGN